MVHTVLPTITWDPEKCKDVIACRKCLIVCHPSVFRLLGRRPGYSRGKYHLTDDLAYGLDTPDIDCCTGCMKCVEVCPENAITVSFEGYMGQPVKSATLHGEI